MYRAYILDDETKAIDNLEYLIRLVLPEVKEIGRSNNPLTAALEIHEFRPDILFLDVQMPHLDGFGLLKVLGKVDFEVIFITAYEEYALHAIKVSALDYLLKPIDEDDLRTAFDKFKSKWFLKNKESSREILKLNKLTQKLAIHQLEGVHFFELDKIIRLASNGNYTEVYAEGAIKLISTKTLKVYEDLLANATFMRVHNSHLINYNKIKSIRKYEIIVMEDDSQVPLSRRRKKELKSRLGLE